MQLNKLSVRRPCTRCERTACVRRLCRPSSGLSLLPSCSMHPVPGVDSPKRLTGNESTVSSSHGIRCGYCSPDIPTSTEQCPTTGENFFEKICLDNNHVLHSFLPPPTSASQSYNLRPRAHSLRNILAISRTPILLHGCFSLTFTNLFYYAKCSDNQQYLCSFSLCLSAVAFGRVVY